MAKLIFNPKLTCFHHSTSPHLSTNMKIIYIYLYLYIQNISLSHPFLFLQKQSWKHPKRHSSAASTKSFWGKSSKSWEGNPTELSLPFLLAPDPTNCFCWSFTKIFVVQHFFIPIPSGAILLQRGFLANQSWNFAPVPPPYRLSCVPCLEDPI